MPAPTFRRAGVFVLVAFLLWALWPVIGHALPGILPLGGLLAFATGWLLAGGAMSRARPLRGVAASALAYCAFGALWVIAWNTTVRIDGDMIRGPELRDPVPVAAEALTWPWQLFIWGVIDPLN